MIQSTSTQAVNRQEALALLDLPVECLTLILRETDIKISCLTCRLFYKILTDPVQLLIRLRDQNVGSSLHRLVFSSSLFHRSATEKTERIWKELLLERQALQTESKKELFLTLAPPRLDLMQAAAQEGENLNLILLFHAVGRLFGYGNFDRERFEELNIRQKADFCRRWFKREGPSLANKTNLDLSKLGLTRMPEELSYFSAATEVDLSGNSLGILHGELKKFWPNVKSIKLSDNKIKFIEHLFFSGLSQLNSLTLKKNQLTSLLPFIGCELPALERVDLSDNILQEIDSDFLSCSPKLKSLVASNNCITTLPEAFGSLWPALEIVNLGFNKLAALPQLFLATNPRVKQVFLQKNSLKALPDGFGRNWERGESLSLKLNHLCCLPEGFGEGMASLKLLDLSYNALKILPLSLSSLQALELLHVSQEVRVQVSFSMLLTLKNLKNIRTVMERANSL